MRSVFGSVFYTFLLFFLQLESSSETRSALENQLERLTRDKVCVGQFVCLFFPCLLFRKVVFCLFLIMVLIFLCQVDLMAELEQAKSQIMEHASEITQVSFHRDL